MNDLAPVKNCTGVCKIGQISSRCIGKMKVKTSNIISIAVKLDRGIRIVEQ